MMTMMCGNLRDVILRRDTRRETWILAETPRVQVQPSISRSAIARKRQGRKSVATPAEIARPRTPSETPGALRSSLDHCKPIQGFCGLS